MTTVVWLGDAPTGSEREQSKGGSHVVDNCSNTDRFVGAGAGEQLHDGWFYSHPAGHCHCCFSCRHHQWAEILIAAK